MKTEKYDVTVARTVYETKKLNLKADPKELCEEIANSMTALFDALTHSALTNEITIFGINVTFEEDKSFFKVEALGAKQYEEE